MLSLLVPLSSILKIKPTFNPCWCKWNSFQNVKKVYDLKHSIFRDSYRICPPYVMIAKLVRKSLCNACVYTQHGRSRRSLQYRIELTTYSSQLNSILKRTPCGSCSLPKVASSRTALGYMYILWFKSITVP